MSGQQSVHGRPDRSWIAVSALGLGLLAIPAYDIWDDVSNLSWGLTETLLENSVLISLALALAYGGVWLARKDWKPEYKRTVAKWNLGIAAVIAFLYAIVVSLQLWVMGELKPLVLALDGVLFGSVAAFGVGTYNANQQIARDDLERSREEYRTLTDDVLDTSDVATFVLDEEFRVVWINEATAEYFDIDREAILGADKRDLIADHICDLFERPERFRDRVTATYDDNTDVEEFECHLLAGAERDERWLQHWSQPIESGLYEGGRIEHYTDITPVKRRERELDRRERNLREMYDAMSDRSLTFEEQVDEMLGIGRRLFDAEYGSFANIDEDGGEYELKVVQSTAADREAGDVVPLAQTHCERLVDEERTLQFEARPFDVEPREYGTDVGFEMYVGTPVYENDTLYGSLCFLDREEADPFDEWQLTMVELMGNWMGYELNRKHLLEERQQELRAQETKFEQFVDTVDNYAIFTLDTEGLVTTWNRGAEQIKGYSEEDIVGEHIEVFYPEEKAADGLPETLLEEALETGQATHEGWRVRKDGGRFWANVTIAARFDDDGDHVGYTKITRDLTERRERERALQRGRERMEFMNRIIRHNVLNGLNLMNARAELLERQFVDDAEARDHLETIHRRGEDLADLIDVMRTFVNAILTDADHDVHPVEIRHELEAKLSLARESYPDAVFDVGDLPEESRTVVADELVGEVFENVLSNAVVHNDEDTPRVDIWTSESTLEVAVDAETGDPLSTREADRRDGETAVEERDALTVHVADNGPGIDADERDAVLKKGVSQLREPGNGFGLYLVREMMRVYGGDVRIRDNDDRENGTVFDLVFVEPA